MTMTQQACSQLRGFNYMPSYAFVLNDIMDYFDEAVWDRELGYAEALHANSVRVWFSSVSFHRDEVKFLKNVERILTLAGKHHLTIMPTLYNRWTDPHYPFGQLDLADVLRDELSQQHQNYITGFMSSFKHDPRIVMWDLCNEPFFPLSFSQSEQVIELLRQQELHFWLTCTQIAKEVRAEQPITIGFCGRPSPLYEELYNALDIISFHPYPGWWNGTFEDEVKPHIDVAKKYNKPLICTETCQGSLDDDVRKVCIQNSLQILHNHQIGWYAWQLCSGSMVSARRDRTDTNAKPGDRGYMPFMLEDGTVRPGHDIIKVYNKL